MLSCVKGLTPDLDLRTCSNLTKKRILSSGCENLQPSLTEDSDSGTSDVSIYSDSTYVDSFQCNIPDCSVSHTSTYKKENASDGYKNPSLKSFMKTTVRVTGNEIIQKMTYHAHQLRDCKKKLIEEYNIAPATVNRWMGQL